MRVVWVIEVQKKLAVWTPLNLRKIVKNGDGTLEFPVFTNSLAATIFLNNVFDKLNPKYEYRVQPYNLERRYP